MKGESYVFEDSFTRMVFLLNEEIESLVKKFNQIRNSKDIMMPEITQNIYLSTRAVEKQIARLKKQKKLKRTGPDKGEYWDCCAACQQI